MINQIDELKQSSDEKEELKQQYDLINQQN